MSIVRAGLFCGMCGATSSGNGGFLRSLAGLLSGTGKFLPPRRGVEGEVQGRERRGEMGETGSRAFL